MNNLKRNSAIQIFEYYFSYRRAMKIEDINYNRQQYCSLLLPFYNLNYLLILLIDRNNKSFERDPCAFNIAVARDFVDNNSKYNAIKYYKSTPHFFGGLILRC